MHSGPLKLRLLTAGLLVALTAGCARHAPLDAWAAGEMHTITGESSVPRDRSVFDPSRETIRLAAAGNATAAFQLAADADDHGAGDLRVSVSELTAEDGSTLPGDAVSTYRVLPVRAADYPAWFLLCSTDTPTPRDYYDVLVPAQSETAGEPWRLAPGERFVAWVDIRVPRDAEPGIYRGTVAISAAGRPKSEFDLELEVYDFVLPDAHVLTAVGGFDHREVFRQLTESYDGDYVPARLNRRDENVREGLTAVRELMQLARRHRLDLFEKTIRPVMKRDSRGNLRLDWDDYDAIVTPYISGSAFEDGEPVAFWPVPLHADWPEPRNYGGYESSEYLDAVAETADEVDRHISREPLAEAPWIYWPVRDDSDDAARNHRKLLTAADALRDLPVLCTLPPAERQSAPQPSAHDHPQMLAPPGEFFDPHTRRQPDANSEADTLTGPWLTPGRPPYAPSLHVAASASDARALPWVAMRYGAKGLLLPEVLGWSEDPRKPRLFYPGPAYGAEGPLPSARLKRLRRGLEDAAACDLLRQRGRGGIARAVANTLIRHAGVEAAGDHRIDARLNGWPDDAATWHRAGRLLANEVLAAFQGEGVDERDFLRQRVAWRLLMDRTRKVRLERVSSRVGPSGDGRFRAELTLDFSNPLAWPVEISLEDIQVEEGWTLADDSGASLELDTNQYGSLRPVLLGERVVATADGKLPVEMTLEMPDGTREVRTAVPLLIVPTVSRRPEIDGRLKDWPLGQGNVAGSFRLIGRRGRGDDGSAERTTKAMVTRDAEHLYVAFRCAEPYIDGMVVHRDNRLRHEQAIPFGEDLVEIVLDPGFKADAPEDLYHIVVKAGGVVRSGRGAPGTAADGTAPWAAGATAAVGTYEDHWVVELAVPLSSFGDNADADWWGVNFARYAAGGAEASSWTGDRRCFYLPRVLGTMFMRRREQD